MWAVTRRAPMARQNDLMTLHNRLDQIMGDVFTGTPFGSDAGAINASWVPAVDVFEGKEAIRIVAELPGVKAADVKIALENNLLTLRGEKQQEAENASEKAHRYERTFGGFERSFALPTTVDADKISAVHADGILTVILPKVEKARPREIPVTSA